MGFKCAGSLTREPFQPTRTAALHELRLADLGVRDHGRSADCKLTCGFSAAPGAVPSSPHVVQGSSVPQQSEGEESRMRQGRLYRQLLNPDGGLSRCLGHSSYLRIHLKIFVYNLVGGASLWRAPRGIGTTGRLTEGGPQLQACSSTSPLLRTPHHHTRDPGGMQPIQQADNEKGLEF